TRLRSVNSTEEQKKRVACLLDHGRLAGIVHLYWIQEWCLSLLRQIRCPSVPELASHEKHLAIHAVILRLRTSEGVSSRWWVSGAKPGRNRPGNNRGILISVAVVSHLWLVTRRTRLALWFGEVCVEE